MTTSSLSHREQIVKKTLSALIFREKDRLPIARFSEGDAQDIVRDVRNSLGDSINKISDVVMSEKHKELQDHKLVTPYIEAFLEEYLVKKVCEGIDSRVYANSEALIKREGNLVRELERTLPVESGIGNVMAPQQIVASCKSEVDKLVAAAVDHLNEPGRASGVAR